MFNEKQKSQLADLVEAIADDIKVAVSSGAAKSYGVAAARILRPYIDKEVTSQLGVNLVGDDRAVLWGYCVLFRSRTNPNDEDWSVAAITDGAVVATDGEIEQASYESAFGLKSVASKVSDYCTDIGATFPLDELIPAFNNLRPTLSRQRGHATMRRLSRDGLWHLTCYIKRMESEHD